MVDQNYSLPSTPSLIIPEEPIAEDAKSNLLYTTPMVIHDSMPVNQSTAQLEHTYSLPSTKNPIAPEELIAENVEPNILYTMSKDNSQARVPSNQALDAVEIDYDTIVPKNIPGFYFNLNEQKLTKEQDVNINNELQVTSPTLIKLQK